MKMPVVKLVVILSLALALGGCSLTPRLTGNMCSVGPTIPEEGFETRWTKAEKAHAVLVNESGAVICGWKP